MYLSELIVNAQEELAKYGDSELMLSVVFSDGKKLIGGMENIEVIFQGNHYEIRGEQI